MKSNKRGWSNGSHAYRGKRNSRFQRLRSKLGIKTDQRLTELIFKKIENESRQRADNHLADNSDNRSYAS